MNVEKVTLKQINRSDALRYLGYGDTVPDDTTLLLLDKCEKELLHHLDCKYLYRIFPLEGGQDFPYELHVSVDQVVIVQRPSGVIRILLALPVRRAHGERAVLVHAVRERSAIEQVCDTAEREIMKSFPGMQHTFRFGLGYGDFPLEGQTAFLNILDARKRIGVSVSPSLMLTPLKSVTCVIGLGEHVANESRKTCEVCSLKESCAYRRAGRLCSQ